MSSVGVMPGSIFRSRGLPLSEEDVSVEAAGRDCSRPAGHERGSAPLILEREEEEEEEAIDGAMSLFTEAVEKVDAIDRRDLHDEAEEEVALEEVVDVDMKEEAVELRPGRVISNGESSGCAADLRESIAWENILWIMCGGCRARRASMCRIDSSGMS